MADTIKIGSLDISAFKVGSSDCKVYLGSTLLYPQSPTPVFEGKYKLTLSDSSTVSAECDSTSAVTRGEVSSQYSGTVVSVEIGNCVTSIGDSAFQYCSSLTRIEIPDSVTSIGNYTFGFCSNLASINIPSGVTSIGNGTFYGCGSLTGITIPNSVTSIGYYAFQYCSSLTRIEIPSGVTSISNDAFYGCEGLSSVTCLATTPPQLVEGTFNDTNNCPILVPLQSVEAYKSASGWSTYASRIQAIPNS